MSRRYTGNMNGERYLANKNKKEVHDLDQETINCQINEILAARHETPFTSLDMAKLFGYDNCHWCLGGSTR